MACKVLSEELAISQVMQSSNEQKNYNSTEQVDVEFNKKKKQFCYQQKCSFYEHIAYFFGLASASYIGVIVRIYLLKLANWNGVPFFPSLYAQMVGTTIMGFVFSHKLLLAKNHSFLYQTLTTGLCGSITTFSSWNAEAISILLQPGQELPTRILGWVTTLLLGLGMPTAALTLGCHIAALSPYCDRNLQRTGRLPEPVATQKTCHSLIFVCVWVLLTVMVVVIPYIFGRFDLVFSSFFASIGTYFRWHLAPLNAAFQDFKLGTFLVNVVGAWLLGGVLLAQDVMKKDVLQELLVGVSAGFCGCLTTVSTFVTELSTLPLKIAYMYAISSIILAQVGLVLIWGIQQWTIG